MDIDNLLLEEIKDEIYGLKDLELGSEQYKVAVDGVTKLTGLAIELEKLNIQDRESTEKRKEAKALVVFDQDFKLKQIDEERKDRFVRNCIAAATVAIPSVITIWGTVKSFEFEKEGTITTTVGRSFMARLFPKR